jgi:hypothetical protein
LLLLLTLVGAFTQICGCGMTCTVAPVITGQPSSQSVVADQPAIFTVAASGSLPLSYRWQKNGINIPGATQATYVTPPLPSTESGSTFAVTVENRFGTLTSVSASLTINPSPSTNVRFVAPNGNDSNVGTIDHPFRTIQQCASTVGQGWTCEVHAGTYRETITPNSGITITAYNLEPVTIDGSDPVSGWTPHQGAIYKAKVDLNGGDSNQVFVGSSMMTEARWPNGDDLFHVNWAVAQSGTDSSHIFDSTLPSGDWVGAKIHLWSGADPFGHETGTVTAAGAGQISIDVGQTGTCPSICPVKGGFYYLFGSLGALDAEREWFYDSDSSTLYFIAPGKVDPNTLDVRFKRRQYAFDLRGKSGVTIQNINIFASTIVTDKDSYNNTIDRINAKYVSHFTSLPTASSDPTGNNFTILQVHVSDSGIIVNGSGNILQNSTISYSAGAGIALEGNNNTIRNNLIQYVDYIGDYASGVDLDGDNNIIQFNTLNGAGRQSVLVNAILNQDISYNNLVNSMMLSRDGGAIYACCDQVASVTRIHHNWIHDTISVINGAGDSEDLSGVYIDNGSKGFEVDQNVLWHNQHESIDVNGASISGLNNNYIHNNTLPDDTSGGIIQVRGVPDCTSLRISDNRVVVGLKFSSNGTACALLNNSAKAPGAYEMLPSVGVGCNFEGCSSTPPPAILDGGSVTPCPFTVSLAGNLGLLAGKRQVNDTVDEAGVGCVGMLAPASIARMGQVN